MPVTPTATFCATITDEWIRHGVRHAVIAPGSRSTPLALALAARAELEIHVVHDERSASFVALGIGMTTGTPAVLLCTSGTAAAEFHAAVVEAHQAEVPLVVCTADRPPELRDTAAPQTIDQWSIYGTSVRWFHDPGIQDDSNRSTWRSLAARAVLTAAGSRPGPVHLNLPFRDPLVGEPGELPVAGDRPAATLGGRFAVGPGDIATLVPLLDRQRGVIVAGGGPGVRGAADAIHALAEQLGWPVLAEPRSGCRTTRPTAIAAFDAILRHPEFASAHTPEVILQFGYPPASKVTAQWISASGATQIQVQASDAWIDPAHQLAVRVVCDPAALCEALDGQLRGASNTPWLARWRRAEARAQATIDVALEEIGALCDPSVSRLVTRTVPDGTQLVVSSSMPVRDLEWFGAARSGLTVHANRGANGIDGIVSTAIGVALGSKRPTVLLIGDLAFVHDSSALVALARRELDLTIVVTDNDGGAIFSFLPQATALPAERFEQLFGTPHHTDIPALAAAHGIPSASPTSTEQLRDDLQSFVGTPGTHVVQVRTERRENVRIHAVINDAVVAAIG